MSDKRKLGKGTRACLIISPRSGQGQFELQEVVSVLLAQDWEVVVREKREKGEATDLAKRAAEDGFDPIVSCGGDGTLNEVVDALVGSDTAVGVIPGGTVNAFAGQVGISSRSRVAATQLAASRAARVDVGRLEVKGERRHHFLMMAGLGADGTVMERVSRGLKTRIGPLAVGVAAAEAWPTMKAVPVRVSIDGVQWEGTVTEIVVSNTRGYGGFTSITPEAYIDDGLLDVCLFTTTGVLEAGRQLVSVLLRGHPSDSSAEQYRCARVAVQAEEPLPLQIDGSALPTDAHGEVEYEFSARPQALTVLLPATYDGALFAGGLPSEAPNQRGKKKRKKKGKAQG